MAESGAAADAAALVASDGKTRVSIASFMPMGESEAVVAAVGDGAHVDVDVDSVVRHQSAATRIQVCNWSCYWLLLLLLFVVVVVMMGPA
jgi:hypothetical protein